VPALIFSLAAQVTDFLVVQMAAVAANSILQRGVGTSLAGVFGASAVGFACYFSFRRGGMYDIAVLPNETRVLKAMFMRWSIMFLMLTISAMLLHHNEEHTRLWLLLFYGLGLAGFCCERLILAWLVRNWLAQGNYIHTVGIIGNGELAQHVASRLALGPVGQKLVGLFTSRQAPEAEHLPGVSELLDFASRNEIDTVIIADVELPDDGLRDLVKKIGQLPLNIYLVPGPIAFEPMGRSWQAGQVFPGLNLFPLVDRPINEMSLLAKSAFDRFVALLLLIFLLPIMLICAAGIRLSGPGPILFRQPRIGYNGRDFMIFKFRTMHVAEHPTDKLTAKNDPRIFAFGKLLRKTSLDELPQLINVLKGDMSLVGPRPHMRQATAAGRLYFDVVSNYTSRHRVKPGITGWAQVNGWRGPTETVDQIKSRVAHDLYYIENWSLLLDLTIMFRTFFVLFGKNVF
jgi:Undecaprenyl-phosphate glucose phosphotransferase